MNKEFIEYRYNLETLGVCKGDRNMKLLIYPERSYLPVLTIKNSVDFKTLISVSRYDFTSNKEKFVEYRCFEGKLYRNVVFNNNNITDKNYFSQCFIVKPKSLTDINIGLERKTISSFEDIKTFGDLENFIPESKKQYIKDHLATKADFERILFDKTGDYLIKFNGDLFIQTNPPVISFDLRTMQSYILFDWKDATKNDYNLGVKNLNLKDPYVIFLSVYDSFNLDYPLLTKNFTKNFKEIKKISDDYENLFAIDNSSIYWDNILKTYYQYMKNLSEKFINLYGSNKKLCESILDLYDYSLENDIAQTDEIFFEKIKNNILLTKEFLGDLKFDKSRDSETKEPNDLSFSQNLKNIFEMGSSSVILESIQKYNNYLDTSLKIFEKRINDYTKVENYNF